MLLRYIFICLTFSSVPSSLKHKMCHSSTTAVLQGWAVAKELNNNDKKQNPDNNNEGQKVTFDTQSVYAG